MRLYIENPKTKEKIFIKRTARNRRKLASVIGSRTLRVKNKEYDVNVVKAAPNETAAAAMALGGVVGVIAGIPGVIIGSAIGGLLGKSSDDEDKKLVEKFNRSKYETP